MYGVIIKDGKWSDIEVTSDETIQMHMADPCLHYGQEVFEGMKVFETIDGRIVAFRPEENAKRLGSSSERVLIPKLPVDKFIEALHKLVEANATLCSAFRNRCEHVCKALCDRQRRPGRLRVLQGNICLLCSHARLGHIIREDSNR